MAGYTARADRAPNPYPLSPGAQRLNAVLAELLAPVNSLADTIKGARAGMSQPWPQDTLAQPIQSQTPPMPPEMAQRLRAQDTDRAEREATFNSNLAGLLARMQKMSGGGPTGPLQPAMPPAIVPGSLQELLNAQRVANPRPSITPPPMIGVRG